MCNRNAPVARKDRIANHFVIIHWNRPWSVESGDNAFVYLSKLCWNRFFLFMCSSISSCLIVTKCITQCVKCYCLLCIVQPCPQTTATDLREGEPNRQQQPNPFLLWQFSQKDTIVCDDVYDFYYKLNQNIDKQTFEHTKKRRDTQKLYLMCSRDNLFEFGFWHTGKRQTGSAVWWLPFNHLNRC